MQMRKHRRREDSCAICVGGRVRSPGGANRIAEISVIFIRCNDSRAQSTSSPVRQTRYAARLDSNALQLSPAAIFHVYIFDYTYFARRNLLRLTVTRIARVETKRASGILPTLMQNRYHCLSASLSLSLSLYSRFIRFRYTHD